MIRPRGTNDSKILVATQKPGGLSMRLVKSGPGTLMTHKLETQAVGSTRSRQCEGCVKRKLWVGPTTPLGLAQAPVDRSMH